MDVASGSTLTINQTISAYPLVKNGLGTLVFNASIIIPAGPPFASLNLNAGTLLNGAPAALSTQTGSVMQFDAAAGPTLFYSSPLIFGGGSLTKTGAGSLVKTGTGTWRLSAGTNTYAGGTTINGGTLSIGSDLRLGNSSGVLTFAGGTLNTSASFTSLRGVHLGTGGGTFDVNNAT